jgi:hypothetical protein
MAVRHDSASHSSSKTALVAGNVATEAVVNAPPDGYPPAAGGCLGVPISRKGLRALHIEAAIIAERSNINHLPRAFRGVGARLMDFLVASRPSLALDYIRV